MLKPLIAAAAILAAPAYAQTAPAEPAGPPATTPPSDNRAAILDDAATTPRAGETDVGATRAPDYRPAGMGGPYSAAKSYPPARGCAPTIAVRGAVGNFCLPIVRWGGGTPRSGVEG